MRELAKPYHFTVTATTRPQRLGERDGVDYIFVTQTVFEQMAERGEFLEWAEVYGHLYGVPKAQVVDALNSKADVIIKADVQGARTIKKLAPEALLIFLAPPNIVELADRLRQRMTESSEALSVRLRTAEQEVREAPKFDYVVINREDRLDEAVAEIEGIVARERYRAPARKIAL